jgi:hypothetical protein
MSTDDRADTTRARHAPCGTQHAPHEVNACCMRDDGHHTKNKRDKPPSASTDFADEWRVGSHERQGCAGTPAAVNFATGRGPNFGARFRPKKGQQSVNPNSWGSHFPALFWGRKTAPKIGPLFGQCQRQEARRFATDEDAAEASRMGCKDKMHVCCAQIALCDAKERKFK